MIAVAPNFQALLSSARDHIDTPELRHTDIEKYSAMTLQSFLYAELPAGEPIAKALYYELMLKFTAKHGVKRSVLEGWIASGDVSLLKDAEILFSNVKRKAHDKIEQRAAWAVALAKRSNLPLTSDDLNALNHQSQAHALWFEHESLVALAKQSEDALREMINLPTRWIFCTGRQFEYLHIYTVNGDSDSRIVVPRNDIPSWIADPIGALSRYFNEPHAVIEEWMAAKECALSCAHGSCRNRFVIRHAGENARTPWVNRTEPYETWFCAAHRHSAWEGDRILGDDTLRVLHAVRARPGRGRTTYLDHCAATSLIVGFLESLNLLSIERRTSTPGRPHQLLTLTASGLQAIYKAKRPPLWSIYSDLDADELWEEDQLDWSFNNDPLAHWVRIETRPDGAVQPLEDHLCGERVNGSKGHVCETKTGSICCVHWVGCRDGKALCNSVIV